MTHQIIPAQPDTTAVLCILALPEGDGTKLDAFYQSVPVAYWSVHMTGFFVDYQLEDVNPIVMGRFGPMPINAYGSDVCDEMSGGAWGWALKLHSDVKGKAEIEACREARAEWDLRQRQMVRMSEVVR